MPVTVKNQTGSPRALLLGTGYCARALIPHLRAAGYAITGTSRQGEAGIFGINMIRFDGDMTKGLAAALGKADIILSSIPPASGIDPVLKATKGRWLDLAKNCRWAGYLSATSVYGDRGGQWVFEDELLYPATARGRARIEAELGWLETGLPMHIFRLAGIYGPQIGGMSRNPFARLAAGKARAVVKPGHMVNRVHVEDIARAVMASMARPDPAQVYNLADGHPAPPQDVLNFAADLAGLPRPPVLAFDSDELSDMARSFYTECKRVSAARAQKDLGWTPKYKDYKTGLTAIYTADHRP